MPDPYHSYLVLAAPWQMSGGGVASIVCVYGGNPLANPNILVSTVGERAVYEMALERLKSLSENDGLESAADEG
jgi:hypothetical protein